MKVSHHYETTIIPIKNKRTSGEASEPQPQVLFESWTPFPDADNVVPFDEAEDIFWTNHPYDQVHQCSAATCEVCVRLRQQGISDRWLPKRRMVV